VIANFLELQFMKIKNILHTLLVAVILISCGPRVTTNKLSEKDLSTYETFAYLPNSNFDDLEKFENDEDVGASIIQNVNRNMKKQGYELERNNPDLLVLLNTSTDIEKTVSNEPIYARYPNYYGTAYTVSPYYQNNYYYDYGGYDNIIGYETNLNRYQEGSLILTLVGSKSKNIVWEGVASDLIFRQNESRAIAKFVDDMFDEFPD